MKPLSHHQTTNGARPEGPSFPSLPSVNLPFAPAPNESNYAFESFLAYFDIGLKRSFAQVAKHTGIGLPTIKLWARKFNWRKRVHAYNTHLLQTRVTIETDARRTTAAIWAERATQLKEKEWAAAEKCIAAAQMILDLTLAKPPEELRPSDAARLLEVASKIGRLACDMATEKTELTGRDGGAIHIELEAALKKAYGIPETVQIIDPPLLLDAEPIPSSQ